MDDKPLGWCRRCGQVFWPDADHLPSREDVEEWRLRRIAEEEARKRSAELALTHLRDSAMWERYYAQLDSIARDYWARRGIPEAFQDYWRLGWDQEHEFFLRGQAWRGAAAVIPFWSREWQLQQIKYRLIDQPDYMPKYLPELHGQPNPLYLCNPDEPLTGHVYLIEGEIKSMVTFARMDSPTAIVCGMPGATPGPHIIEALGQAERITLVMDPDARAQGIALARALGLKRTWLLIPPYKIDDGIVADGLDSHEVKQLLHSAVYAPKYIGGNR
jgi:hypothetical protein